MTPHWECTFLTVYIIILLLVRGIPELYLLWVIDLLQLEGGWIAGAPVSKRNEAKRNPQRVSFASGSEKIKLFFGAKRKNYFFASFHFQLFTLNESEQEKGKFFLLFRFKEFHFRFKFPRFCF